MTDANESKDLDEALDQFYAASRQRDTRDFMLALAQTMGQENIRVPAPSTSSWKPFVTEFNRQGRARPGYAWFLNGPTQLQALLARHEDALAQVPLNTKNLNSAVASYADKLRTNLGNFDQTLNRLAQIPVKQLLEGRKSGNTHPAELRALQALTQTSGLDMEQLAALKPHLDSLRAWSTTAINGFRGYSPRAPDPCPNCPTRMGAIARAYEPIKDMFPIVYRATLSTQTKESGLVILAVNQASDAQLDELFQALEYFRNPDANKLKHLQKRALVDELQRAIAWMDSIKMLRGGQITLSYVYRNELERANTILNFFTICELKGLYSAKRMSLNSPSASLITLNPDVALDQQETIIELYNRSQSNNRLTRLELKGGPMSLYALVLDGSKRDQAGKRFEKEIIFQLDTRPQDLSSQFQFTFSQPVASPPAWYKIR